MTTVDTVQMDRFPARLEGLARRPLAAFFSIAIIGSWLAVLPVLLSRNGFGLLPIDIPIEPFRTIGSFTGPFLAAFAITYAQEGQRGVKALLRRLVEWRMSLGWYLLAVFGFIVMDLLVGVLLFGPAALAALAEKWPLIFTVYFPALLTYRLISPIGEETGWTGFAVPYLQKRGRPWAAAVILGLFWGVWHLPGFFMAGGEMGPFDPVGFVFFLVYTVTIRVIWIWVANHTGASVLIGVLIHAASNATSVDLRPQLFPPAPPEAGLLAMAIYLLIAIVILLATRGRLSYHPQDDLHRSSEMGFQRNH